MNEVVPHSTEHTAAIASFYQKNEALEDLHNRRMYFASLDGSDFLDLLQQVNSLIRTGDDFHLQHFDGETAKLAVHAPPDQTDKEPLLRETWEVAKEFLKNGELNDEDALTYAGLVVAGGTLLTHPFVDSNGRTSRVVSHMLIKGSSKATQEDIMQLLDIDSGTQAWAVTPLARTTATYANYSFGKSAHLPVELDWSASQEGNMDEKAKDDPVKTLYNSMFRDRALHFFMRNADATALEKVKQYTKFDESGKPLYLNVVNVLDDLVNDPEHGISYAAQLAEAEKWARADYVRRYLRSMKEEVFQELSPYYATRIQSIMERAHKDSMATFAEIKTFGELAVDGKLKPRDHAKVVFSRSTLLRK